MQRPRTSFLALLLIVLALPACGIVFSADFSGTEVFRKFELDGSTSDEEEFAAGAPIAVKLTVNQAYPVPLAISCGYENVDITDDQRKVAFNERAFTVFEAMLPANPGYDPNEDAEVEDQVLSFEFSESEPGDYFVACFTPAAPENGIGRGFTIAEP